ncbi:MAG: hypothetical protein ABSE28_16665 [Candidatus Sulfotelmatobacter sp.]|jgi:hypothetical protein
MYQRFRELVRGWRELPRLEAVVASLGYDLAVTKFNKHCGIGTHLGPCQERYKRDGKFAGPHNLEDNGIAIRDVVKDLVDLVGKKFAVFSKASGI